MTEAAEHFVTCIQKAAWNAIPSVSARNKGKYASKQVQSKISEKRHFRKLWQQTRYHEYKTSLNKMTKEGILRKERQLKDEKFLKSLDPTCHTDYSLWKAAKKLTLTTPYNPPLRKQDDSWTKSDKEKAELFGNHLKNVFSPIINAFPNDFETEISQCINVPHQLDIPIKKILMTELLQAIDHLNVKKAPGYDLVTGKVLKELPGTAHKFLLHLLNACLHKTYFPVQWKVAEMKMILKPGKIPEQVDSYRPISLLTILSKLLERLFLKRLMPVIDEKKTDPKPPVWI
jgi:hypothetical protein